jgi:Ca2+-binding EF-hand superfamily protein
MRTHTLLAALLLAATTTAFAADTQPDRTQKTGAKMREKFNTADIDHDGLISRDEATKGMPHIAKHFDAIDADHDGKLSMQELAQFRRNKRGGRTETP